MGPISLLAIEGGDLEAEAPVVTVDRHDRGVVEVRHQPACHFAPALLHQVASLREEVLPLPGRRHQTRLTESEQTGEVFRQH